MALLFTPPFQFRTHTLISLYRSLLRFRFLALWSESSVSPLNFQFHILYFHFFYRLGFRLILFVSLFFFHRFAVSKISWTVNDVNIDSLWMFRFETILCVNICQSHLRFINCMICVLKFFLEYFLETWDKGFEFTKYLLVFLKGRDYVVTDIVC